MSDKLIIEQRHRDAAAETMSKIWTVGNRSSDYDRMLDGRLDEHWAVQAFARFEASLRTPTPEQAGEAINECRYLLSNAKEHAHDTEQRHRVGLAIEWLDKIAALQSTPPAQPTADAVRALYEAVSEADDAALFSPGTPQTCLIPAEAWTKVLRALGNCDDTMAGDYVMVGYAPKGHLKRYLKGQNTGCWIYGSPTADDDDALFVAASPTGGE